MTTTNTPSSVPPQARYLQWTQGWATLMLCHALVKTGVFEQLAGQACTVDELAAACQVRPDVLRRVLRLTTAQEITTHENDRFGLAALGRMMLKGTPGSMYNAALLSGSEGYQRPWANFAYCLTTGESAFTHVMGAPFFGYLEQHPDYGIPFQQQSQAYAMMDPSLVAAYDFSPFRTICDVGGGTGSFLKRILEAYPLPRGILFDLPGVVANHVLDGMADRAEIVAGSFFERVPSADLLILKTVLHDWSSEKCAVILDRCCQALQPASRLLIIDRVLDEPVDTMSAFYDLHMLVQIGGQERTAEEFRILLGNAGLQLQRIIVPTESPLFPLRLIEASL